MLGKANFLNFFAEKGFKIEIITEILRASPKEFGTLRRKNSDAGYQPASEFF